MQYNIFYKIALTSYVGIHTKTLKNRKQLTNLCSKKIIFKEFIIWYLLVKGIILHNNMYKP